MRRPCVARPARSRSTRRRISAAGPDRLLSRGAGLLGRTLPSDPRRRRIYVFRGGPRVHLLLHEDVDPTGPRRRRSRRRTFRRERRCDAGRRVHGRRRLRGTGLTYPRRTARCGPGAAAATEVASARREAAYNPPHETTASRPRAPRACPRCSLPPAALAQTRADGGRGRSSDMAAGRRIFDAQCAWCHGNGGDGGTGPNLHGRLRHATTLDSIVDIITNGIPGTDMPSFRLGLTERSTRQTAAYVLSLSRSAPRPAAGQRASAARRCTSRTAADPAMSSTAAAGFSARS